jgi:ABC-type sugar transport system ATPase subunit
MGTVSSETHSPSSPGAASQAAPEIIIEAERLTKTFGGTRALDDVSLSVQRGEIHALVGENGAGKSTLLGILSGRVVPTSGQLKILGTPLNFGNPRLARQYGIATIYQELTMIPALSAEENVFLGQEPGPGAFLSKNLRRQKFKQLCDNLEVEIEGERLVRELPIAQQQILEILRGVAANARIMLFDEPTAALPEHERESALRLIRRLRDHDVSIIYVSHNLEEVLAISDRTSVLRNGQLMETKSTTQWNERDLVRMMLGHEIQATQKRTRQVSDQIVIRAEGVTVPGAIQNITLEARAGEIVGLAGLVGSGRTTLLRSMAGLEPTSHGRFWVNQREVPWPHSPRTAIRYGIAMVPEDRKRQGLILGMSVADNVTLTFLDAISRLGFINKFLQYKVVSQLLEHFGVSPDVMPLPATSLSGGNQQRVLIAKWLHREPLILLADEPTRGIDVGAKVDVLDKLQDLAEAGKAIVMTSSDLEEVLSISDRVVVLAEGKLVDELANDASQLKVSDLLERAFRVRNTENNAGEEHAQ